MGIVVSKKTTKDFISWYRSPNKPKTVEYVAPSYQPSQEAKFESFISELQNSINENDVVDLKITQDLPVGDFSIRCDDKSKCNINLIHLHTRGNKSTKLTLSGLRINSLQIHYSGFESLHFENCDIKKLLLYDKSELTLKDCGIGQITFKNVAFLYIENGFILDFICPVPGEGNPFSGSISLQNTFIPRDTKNYLLTGPQPYRNIRYYLKSIENGRLANLFHSAELAVERETDSFFNKIISHAYESLSDFGASALRPILWWFVIGFAGALLIYYVDGAVNALANDSSYCTGWRRILIDSNGYRSAYLSFQSMLNPLGVLGIKPLVIPATGWLVAYLLFQGLLSAIIIALIIFAIRRRFKISN